MSLTKISDKYQIVIPKNEREKLNLKRGQKIVVYTIGSHLVLSPESHSYTEKLAGLGKDLWQGIDALEYVKKERKEWSKN